MSLMQGLIKRAISTISAASAIVVERHNGSDWVAIPDAIWHERSGVPEQDVERNQENFTRQASLTIPDDGPALAYGSRVRVDSVEFRVVGTLTLANQKRYSVEHSDLLRSTPDRGAL